MKELDVVLTRFYETHYQQADQATRNAFHRLLEMQDPDLYALLLGREVSADAETGKLLKRITETN